MNAQSRPKQPNLQLGKGSLPGAKPRAMIDATKPTPSLLLGRMREATPLVQCITNYVAMNFTANVLLAAGASPAMVHAPEEAGEFAANAGALTVNIATLSPDWIKGMTVTAQSAHQAAVPLGTRSGRAFCDSVSTADRCRPARPATDRDSWQRLRDHRAWRRISASSSSDLCSSPTKSSTLGSDKAGKASRPLDRYVVSARDT